jgi:hypothetical protein
MLNTKYLIVLFCFLLIQNSFGQIKINSNASTGAMTGNSAFLDASSAPSWKSSTNIGKGMIFPNVDLTTLMTMAQSGSSSATNNPNRFDGMLVYNTATGTSGIGNVAVKPGFFYYSNATTNLNGGTWISVGGASATALGVIATVANYTVLDADSTIFCDATSAGFALTLPNPVGKSGKVYVIRKTDPTDNAITFSPSLVYSQGSLVSSLNYVKTIRIQSDGTNWNIID